MSGHSDETTSTAPGTARQARPDLRELEARLEARLQAVSTRFARVDQRIARLEAAGILDTTAIAEIAATVTAVVLRQTQRRPTGNPGNGRRRVRRRVDAGRGGAGPAEAERGEREEDGAGEARGSEGVG